MGSGNGDVDLQRRRASRIARRLEETYGTPQLGNKEDPLDELIFIVLSQMTTGPSYSRVFDRLKGAVERWDELPVLPLRALRAVIKDAGLSGQKGPRLKAIVKRVCADFDSATLDPLARMTDQEVEAYLTSLPGVGVKTAKCVMMYSLGRRVLPVDTHVKRVLVRVGLLSADLSNGRLHEAAERVVHPTDRYSIHVNGVVHGRRVCSAVRPRCDDCCLKRSCGFRRAVVNQTR